MVTEKLVAKEAIRFQVLEHLNQDDQETVIKIIDAIIAKGHVEAALMSVDETA